MKKRTICSTSTKKPEIRGGSNLSLKMKVPGSLKKEKRITTRTIKVHGDRTGA